MTYLFSINITRQLIACHGKITTCPQLYEQDVSKQRIGGYLRRWLGWAFISIAVRTPALADQTQYTNCLSEFDPREGAPIVSHSRYHVPSGNWGSRGARDTMPLLCAPNSHLYVTANRPTQPLERIS